MKKKNIFNLKNKQLCFFQDQILQERKLWEANFLSSEQMNFKKTLN